MSAKIKVGDQVQTTDGRIGTVDYIYIYSSGDAVNVKFANIKGTDSYGFRHVSSLTALTGKFAKATRVALNYSWYFDGNGALGTVVTVDHTEMDGLYVLVKWDVKQVPAVTNNVIPGRESWERECYLMVVHEAKAPEPVVAPPAVVDSRTEFLKAASKALAAVARAKKTLTTDDLWAQLQGKLTVEGFKAGPKLMGRFMLAAAKEGVVKATETYIKSKQPAARRRPIVVWESLIHQG